MGPRGTGVYDDLKNKGFFDRWFVEIRGDSRATGWPLRVCHLLACSQLTPDLGCTQRSVRAGKDAAHKQDQPVSETSEEGIMNVNWVV